MIMSHKKVSTPSNSGIGSLVHHLRKVLPKAGAKLNKPALKSEFKALLSLLEREQTLTSADHSTLLCQTKAALALYDWVNPALGLQRDPSLKAPCLLAAIEAHATITELLKYEAIDEAQINEIGLRIFSTSVDLTTIETVKKDYLDLRKTSVEARLHTMFQNLVTAPFTPMDSHALNPVPTAAEFTLKAAQLLTLLFETMCPGLAERSLPISDRWLALMAAAKGIKISPRIFDSVRATGPIGTALDTRLTNLQNEAVKTAFGDLLRSIRTRQTVVQGIEKQRWEAAEQRVGMAVEPLLGKPDIRPDQAAACCALIDHWTGTVGGTCSVGVDLQLIDFQDELATIFGGVNQSTLNTKVASWVVARVSELLREKCALPELLSLDVHHVNLAIRLILAHMKVSDSHDFSDPYAAGMWEIITSQKDTIAQGFLEVYLLLDTLHCSSGLSLEALEDGGVIETRDTHALDLMAWRRLAESCMKELDFADFKSMEIKMHELDGKLGCHGRLGIAARLGKADYFYAILGGNSIDPESVFTRDEFNCTLMDYAALGGNVAILDSCMSGVSEPDWDTLFADSPLPQNTLALAAESGNAAMVARVAGLVGDVWTTRLMMARDEQGFDPLMWGVMSENVAVVRKVMAMLETRGVRLETVNERNWHGQTPLILAIESGSSEITGLLLAEGADPNARVSGSDDGISPLELAMSKGNSDVVRVLLTHEGITLHESLIHDAANGACLVLLLDVAFGRLEGDDLASVFNMAIRSGKLIGVNYMGLCRMAISKKLTGRDLAFVLDTAIESGKRTGVNYMGLCRMAINKKLTGYDLDYILNTAIESGNLTGANYRGLCRMAISKKLTGYDLASVFNMAIRSGKLTVDQCMALCVLASKNLTERELDYVLNTAIRSGKLNEANYMALCHMAISEKLTGCDLASVFNMAIRSSKLTGEECMELCHMAISEKLTGDALASVLSTAIRSRKLTGDDDCMALCHIAKEKLTGDALASVLSTAIQSGKLTGDDDCMALCHIAKEKLTGDALASVLTTAIQSRKLTGDDDCMALCHIAKEKLTGDALASVLNMAILDGPMTGAQCMDLCVMEHKHLTGRDLASVFNKAIVYGKLNGAQYMTLCSIANSKLTEGDLVLVFSTALLNEQLTGDQCIALCRMAIDKKLIMDDLVHVFSTAIRNSQLTEPQRQELTTMAGTHNIVIVSF